MNRLLVFGVGTSCCLFNKLLNRRTAEIIAYVDNCRDKWGKVKDELIIISPNKINKYKYDFIVIASDYVCEIYHQLVQLGVVREKIFIFNHFLYMNHNPIEKNIKKISNKIHSLNGLITGISYHRFGIIEQYLSCNFQNISYDSQDLFYDYNLVNYVLKKLKAEIKYLIIGVSYYSFQYDLSLSSFKNKVLLYKKILKNTHNYTTSYDVYNEHEINKNIGRKILQVNACERFFKLRQSQNFEYIDNKDMIGRYQAELDSNKNYPNTVKENIKILQDYFELLKEYKIHPIVVVMPVTKYYSKYFSCQIRNQFYDIIEQFKKQYSFQYIDYFYSDLFDDKDFADVSHLNFNGAKKFTTILNGDIQF